MDIEVLCCLKKISVIKKTIFCYIEVRNLLTILLV